MINKLYKLGAPETGRDDLVAVLLTGVPKLNYTGPKLADVLRLNLDDPRREEPEPARRARRRHAGLAERPPPRRRRDRHRRAGGRRLPEGREAAARRRRQRRRRRRCSTRSPTSPTRRPGSTTRRASRSPDRPAVPAGASHDATGRHRTARSIPSNQACATCRHGDASTPPTATMALRRRSRAAVPPCSESAASSAASLGELRRRARRRRPPPRRGVDARRGAPARGGTAATVARARARGASRPGDAGPARRARARLPAALARDGRRRRSCRSPSARSGRALDARPQDAAATLGLGNLALIRHDFRGALALGREARRRAPFARAALRRGRRRADRARPLSRRHSRRSTGWRAVKPSLASYARVAYARELTRRPRGRRSRRCSSRSTPRAASPSRPPGRTSSSRSSSSATADRRSAEGTSAPRSTIFPGYVLALEQQARVDAARGRLGAAIATARRAATAVPLPQFVALLGDLLERQGRAAAAARQRATVAAIDRVLAANGAARRPRGARSSGPTTASGRRRRCVSRAAPAPTGRRSTATTRSAGRSRAQGAAHEAEPWLDRALRLGTQGRAPLLPPRVRGRLRGRPAARCARGTAGRSSRARRSRCGGRPSREGRSHEARCVGRRRLSSSSRSALALPRGAAAHPLGNFTVNHYAGIELAGRPRVRPVRPRPRRDPDLPVGRPRPRAGVRRGGCARARAPARRRPRRRSRPLDHRVSERPGAGGLPTLRFEAVYVAPLRGDQRSRSPTGRSRAGSAGARSPCALATGRASSRRPSRLRAARTSSARTRATSSARLSTSASATVRFAPGSGRGCAAGARRSGGAGHIAAGGFAALIARRDPTLRRRAGLAPRRRLLGCGARAHPGAREGARRRLPRRHARTAEARVRARRHGDGHPHGRSVRARARDARALDGRSSRSSLYPWLTLVSGLLVVGVGAGVLRRAPALGHGRREPPRARPHTSPRPSASPITTIRPSAASRLAASWGSGSPRACCPARRRSSSCSARSPSIGSRFGLALIVAFSVGLAATITGIGLVAVLARRAFGRARLDGPVIRALPAVSAAVIVVAGLAITAKAIPGVL